LLVFFSLLATAMVLLFYFSIRGSRR
jgi:hypothetical protein